MDNFFSKVEDLASDVKEYVNLKIESAKLDAAEKSSLIIANAAARLIAGIFILFFLVLASIALSLLVADWLGSRWLGFLCVAGFYLLIAVLVWSMRLRLIRLPVMNSIIQQLFTKDDADK